MTQTEIESEVARFKPQHRLYIDQNDDNTQLYRVFPLDSLFEVLIENKLTLVKTKFWEDPYENYIFKCNWAMQDGTKIDPTRMIDQFFGQCWTITEESDAMWRNDLFEEITLDPKINGRFETIYTETIRRMGYTGTINKSVLYRLDPVNIKI